MYSRSLCLDVNLGGSGRSPMAEAWLAPSYGAKGISTDGRGMATYRADMAGSRGAAFAAQDAEGSIYHVGSPARSSSSRSPIDVEKVNRETKSRASAGLAHIFACAMRERRGHERRKRGDAPSCRDQAGVSAQRLVAVVHVHATRPLLPQTRRVVWPLIHGTRLVSSSIICFCFVLRGILHALTMTG